jgi:Na+-driven multidrug efflux pump
LDRRTCFRDFAQYCTLNVLGMLALSCYILADTYFVANALGQDGLAALNLAIPVYSFIHGTGLMLGMGGATRFSILKHQGRENESCVVFTHVLTIAAIFAGCFFACGGLFAQHLATWLGAEGAVLPMTQTYIQVLCFFSPAFLLNDLLLCFVRNDGAPQRAMVAMVSGSLSNIVLDYLFMAPLNLGIFGAVFATGLAPLISLGILSPFFLRRRNTFYPVPCRPSPSLVGLCTGAGIPSLVTEVSSGVVMIVFNFILLYLQGSLGVAAYGVVANLSLVVLAIFTGIAQGIQPLLSRYWGTGVPTGIGFALRYAMITVGVVSVALNLLVSIWAGPIASIFNESGDPALQATAVKGLRLYFTAFPWAGWNIVLSMYFTSTAYPRPAHAISLLRGFLLIIPLAFLLPAFWGITGLWLAFPLTEVFVFLLACLLYQQRKRHLDFSS